MTAPVCTTTPAAPGSILVDGRDMRCYPCRRSEHGAGTTNRWTGAPSRSVKKCRCRCHHAPDGKP